MIMNKQLGAFSWQHENIDDIIRRSPIKRVKHITVNEINHIIEHTGWNILVLSADEMSADGISGMNHAMQAPEWQFRIILKPDTLLIITGYDNASNENKESIRTMIKTGVLPGSGFRLDAHTRILIA